MKPKCETKINFIMILYNSEILPARNHESGTHWIHFVGRFSDVILNFTNIFGSFLRDGQSFQNPNVGFHME